MKRLFQQFQPKEYQLDLVPDKKTMRFSGTVSIAGVKTGRPSQRISLHQKALKVTKAKLSKIEKGKKIPVNVARLNSQNTYDELRIHSQDMLYPGEYIIELEFNGQITKPMHGLYPCDFEHEGQQKMLLATQFESHHAREVFPCIDEPEAKATFDLSLTAPEHEIVLSNTPAASTTKAGTGYKKVTFEKSPVMSTYLLAFVIGEMHCAQAKTKSGVEIRTWATVAQPAELTKYANDEAVKLLDFFIDYFRTPFPLKKCDQVALPDFESGAMENWGLITYREIALLADPTNRSQSSEQYISMVVAHELSHQWFGNLVTMKWWNDLWLNESFASLMEHIALDALHPDWFQWEDYMIRDAIPASNRDIFKDVQPVHVDVNHPDEIGTLFDPAIVYAKGGRLLKMMREYIGETAFRSALKAYFSKHAYKNTIGNDLWEEMSIASGKDVKNFMTPWLEQSGMPAIDVKHSANKIDISQKRFILDDPKDKSLWPVPLLASQKLEIEVLESSSAQINRPNNQPVIFNQNGSGHMLVHYTDKPTREFVAAAFGSQKLKPQSRINILNDLLLLARRGDALLTEGIDIAAKSASEPRDSVWQVMSRAISTAMQLTEGDEATDKNIKKFRIDLAKVWHKKLGWDDGEDESPNQKGLRQTILGIMVASEEESALEEATKRYKKAKNAADLPAEQRAMIIGAVVRNGENVVDDLIKQYKTVNDPDTLQAISAGLTNTKDEKTGGYIIEKALNDKGFVRSQDIFRWYAYLMRNRYTRRLAWEWLQKNWDRLEEMFGDSKSFEYFVVYSAAFINTPAWQKEFIKFYKPKSDIVALRRNIKIATAEIEARVQWRKREEPLIKKYFQNI